MATNIVARATYTPRPYDGSVWLYRSAEGAIAGDTYGLPDVVRAELHVRDVGGTHFDLMSDAHAASVAARVCADLDTIA
jgi:thioesterase domain-containing protein